MRRFKLSLCVVVFVLSPVAAAGQANTLVLHPDGRVLLPFKRGERLQTIRVEVRGGAPDVDERSLHCRALQSFDNTAGPSEIDAEHTGTVSGRDLIFQIPAPATADVLFCSFLRKDNAPLTLQAQKDLEEALAKAAQAVVKAQQALDATSEGKALAAVKETRSQLEQKLASRRREVKEETAQIEKQITQFQEDITAFQQRDTEGAVAEIKRLQNEIRLLRSRITSLAAEIAKVEEAFKGQLPKLIEAENAAQSKVHATAEAATLTKANAVRSTINAQLAHGTQRRFTVLHYSHLLVGRHDKPVYYRLLHRAIEAQNEVTALERAAHYPVFTTDSRIYAVVFNRKRSELPSPFRLTFTQTAGSPPDPAPVRPTFAAKLQSGVDSAYAGLDDAYGDFVMSLGAPFKANTILKVTIATTLTQTTQDSSKTTTKNGKAETEGISETKLQSAELLKDEEYPQIRGLYHFNFTSGVALSFVRDATFVRRAVKANDPATTDKDESEYEDQEVTGDMSVKPMFAISVYFTPIDIQKPLTWRDRIRPAAVLGFSFVNPQDNVYIGGAIEPMKSLQVMAGIHIGKITKKRQPAAAVDVRSPTAPATDQRFDSAFFFGASFNVGFIKTIFSGS